MRTSVITISRQFGSGGSYIGQQVAKRLDSRYADRDILRRASDLLGQEEVALSGREERLSSFWERFFRAFASGTPEMPYVPPSIDLVSDRNVFEAEARIIREIADRQNAVIVGRGGGFILKGRPGAARVFIHASEEFRIKRVIEVYRIPDADQARSTIETMDRERKRFAKTMLGVNWPDARDYHLCIDTSAVGLEEAVEMVIRLVRAMSGEP